MHDDSTPDGIIQTGIIAIGMGPGDPQLLTLKAVNAWSRVKIVYTLRPSGRTMSRCAETAVSAGLDTEKIREVEYKPVSGGDTDRWLPYLDEIKKTIEEGGSAGFATIGDPSIYSGWPAFHEMIKKEIPGCPVEVIPGIPAGIAASAGLKVPLVQGREGLAILPVPDKTERLLQFPEEISAMILYKAEGKTKALADFVKKHRESFELEWVSECGTEREQRGSLSDLAGQSGKMMTIILKKI